MRCGSVVAPVRSAPDDHAEQVTQLLLDEPVEVEERISGWWRIRTAYGYPGWVRDGMIVEGAGAIAADRLGETEVAVARSYLGSPYLWGGLTEAGIDCSGLVHMAFRRTGRLVPRDAQEQAAAAVTLPEPTAGDLLFYGDPVDHVAFWVGGGRILHATGRDGLGVVEEAEPESLQERPRRAGRLSG